MPKRKKKRQQQHQPRQTQFPYDREPNGCVSPKRIGGDIAGPGGPHDVGGVIIDTTDVLLVEHVEVVSVNAVRNGQSQPAIFMKLDGRINRKADHARVGCALNDDGVAAIVCELLAIHDRIGVPALDALTRRMVAAHQNGVIDIARLVESITKALVVLADDPGMGDGPRIL